ncbi:MAG: nucleotide exchange factor GrpE [Nitriliruptoraceae bacterium]
MNDAPYDPTENAPTEDRAPAEAGFGDEQVTEPEDVTPLSASEPQAEDAQGDAEEQASELDVEALADADPRSKAELLSELWDAEAKRDEYLDDLRRSHADFENYRRRVMREGATQRTAGRTEVVTALLEVLDDLDRTLAASADSEDQEVATGIRLVATKITEALAGLGLERIDETEVSFDPNVHEAVQQQPGDGIDGEPQVAAVLRPGYRLDDRVLRPAMVAVQG